MHAGQAHRRLGDAPGIRVEGQYGGRIVVTRRWAHAPSSVIVFGLWASTLAAMIAVRWDDGSWLAFIAAFFVATGYVPIALVVNRTRFEASGDRLSIRHGPLWWPGAKRNMFLSGVDSFKVRTRSRHRSSKEQVRELVAHYAQGHAVVLLRCNFYGMSERQAEALAAALTAHVHAGGGGTT